MDKITSAPGTDPIINFDLKEQVENDGWVRICVSGELDLAVADRLSSRIRALSSAGSRVRLDLSKLNFIDSSGIRVLIIATVESSENRWPLEIVPDLTPQVRRVVELMGLRPHFWPNIPADEPPERAVTDG